MSRKYLKIFEGTVSFVYATLPTPREHYLPLWRIVCEFGYLAYLARLDKKKNASLIKFCNSVTEGRKQNSVSCSDCTVLLLYRKTVDSSVHQVSLEQTKICFRVQIVMVC